VIRFKRIRWKNFLSTGNLFTEIQLDKSDTTLVIGENGAGKSTLLDALTFVLFNKPYRSVNLPQLVSSVNERECVVEVEFSDGSSEYRIVRGQSPKVFEVWCDGKLMDQDAKARDYQKMLEESILGMNYRSFCQVVILGSANYVPFMRLPAAERRAVVESILDIGIFGVMNATLKERISENKEEVRHAESAVAVTRERVALLRRMVEDDRKRQRHDEAWESDQVAAFEKTISEAKVAVADATAEISTLMDSIADRDSVGKAAEQYASLKTQMAKRIATLRKQIAFYEGNDTCPTCTQRIDDAFKSGMVDKGNARVGEMEKAVVEIEGQVALADERTVQIAAVIAKVRTLNAVIVSKNNEIASAENNMKLVRNRRDVAVQDKTSELDEAMRGEEDALDGKRELVEEAHYLSLASTLLKDGGIKSRIIRNYIPVINETINKYLTQMNFFVDFRLDEEFTETIRSRHRDEFTYASFSEGEKRKIDLALLFAWRRIASLKNSITTNILILDEILDGSLDDQATDSFLNIVNSLDKDTNTFVISHKPKEVLQDKFDRTLQFVKRGNFSRMMS
jgi:DNA repair exonuclease SbcCD ATPase subunit